MTNLFLYATDLFCFMYSTDRSVACNGKDRSVSCQHGHSNPETRQDAVAETPDVRQRILDTASTLFYERGVRAVGVDLVVDESGVAKTSLYRHFRTKDDLIVAFLEREDVEFWNSWSRVTDLHKSDPVAELEAHLDWIGERVGRPNLWVPTTQHHSAEVPRTRPPRPQSRCSSPRKNSDGASRGSPSDYAFNARTTGRTIVAAH